ncbi:glycosyltransferase [Candidatus Pantoea carbekii]|uniref:Uncharacterized protein n=1 Tax=Candidatus Pantoea carbekii TaxID=1235990 RepID=U3U1R3_9GAMM|nr:glycosyltransferase [Candidatus Pantoea carbekii]AKC32347.1 Glycosyltransferase [Candidatus Pantoea carbekii]BAO00066.1 hypothetical protein HHS_00960 [Candidatus Pantoea carbekii]
MKSNKKKILLLDNGEEWGGGTNSMLELLKRINRENFSITCCFYNNYFRGNGESLDMALSSLKIPVLFIPKRKKPQWVKIIQEFFRIALFFSKNLKIFFISYVNMQWKILPNAKKISSLLILGKYDILYMNNQPSTNIEGYIAAKKLNVAVVQHCRIQPSLNKKLVKMINENCDMIIAVSHSVNVILQKHGVDEQRCIVIPNAIDTHQSLPDRFVVRMNLKISPKTFIFGTIGSLIARKSHHHILQALGKFKKINSSSNWKFIIVGTGPERQSLQDIAFRENLHQHVIFTGFQNNALDYLSTFDIFILASSKEGLPRVILEAMLVNTSVIGSNVTGTAELITHNVNGLLFEYGNIAQLTKYLTRLYNNAELRMKFTRAAGQHVRKHYVIENYVSGVESIFFQVYKQDK